jgi:hypothetical protein
MGAFFETKYAKRFSHQRHWLPALTADGFGSGPHIFLFVFLFLISIICPTIIYIIQYYRITKSQLKSTTTLCIKQIIKEVAKQVAQQVATSLKLYTLTTPSITMHLLSLLGVHILTRIGPM